MSTEELKLQSREALGQTEANEPVPGMLTVPEACKYLRVSRTALYRLFQTRKLASVKIGKRRLIPMHSLAKFIEQLEEERED